MPELNRPIRTGDHVYHVPSDETWVVAYADYETGRLAPCGWPPGEAQIADCRVVKATDDAASWALVERIAAMPERDFRARWCRRLLREREAARDG